jgi:putative endonuclease
MYSNIITGNSGEISAINYLKRHNFKIVEKNFRCRFGEVDIIAEKEKSLHFIEVKTRRSLAFGEPVEAIDWKKIEKMKICAEFFLQNNDYSEHQIEFDAICISRQKNKSILKFLENIS